MDGETDLTGGWCWFQDPRVVAAAEHTFVGWTEYDTRGTISVARVDHGSGEFEVARGVGETPALAPDDHNAPAIHVRPDGRVAVFYTAHNRDDGNRYRVSREPYGLDFGPERTLPDEVESTYPVPVRVPDTGELFYFYRDRPAGRPGTFYYYRSGDGGETWSDRRRLFDIEGDDYSGYIKVDAAGDRIDVCFSRHPRSAPLGGCDVRHFYYDAGGDTFRDSHGEPLQAPVREEAMTRVFDAREAGERGWIWDVRGGEQPAIAFASYTDGDERDQRYYRARHGGEWSVAEVAATDHLHATNTPGGENEAEYAPGICFGRDPDVLYLSRNAEPRSDTRRGLRIEEWRGEDGRFRRERVVARGDRSNQFRPVVPRSADGGAADSPVRVVWMRGQSRAPYYYHDETETVRLAAEIETPDGADVVPMEEWEAYEGWGG